MCVVWRQGGEKKTHLKLLVVADILHVRGHFVGRWLPKRSRDATCRRLLLQAGPWTFSYKALALIGDFRVSDWGSKGISWVQVDHFDFKNAQVLFVF